MVLRQLSYDRSDPMNLPPIYHRFTTILLILCAALTACAQSKLTTPVTVLPNAAHTVGGQIKIVAPNGTDLGSIQCTVNACIFTGKANGNGNIVFQPGNVMGLAGVVVLGPRLDSDLLTLFDASGTTTNKAIIFKTFGGTTYFSIQGGTDASNPGGVTMHRFASVMNDAIGSAIFQTGAGPALSATSASGPGIVAGGGGGPGFHSTGGGFQDDGMAGGGIQTVCVDNTGLLNVTGPCGGSTPGAWTNYTPSATNLSSVTINAARFQQLGKTVYVRFSLSGTSNGGAIQVTMPTSVTNTSLDYQVLACTSTMSAVEANDNGRINPANAQAYFFTRVYTNLLGVELHCTGVYESN